MTKAVADLFLNIGHIEIHDVGICISAIKEIRHLHLLLNSK